VLYFYLTREQSARIDPKAGFLPPVCLDNCSDRATYRLARETVVWHRL
jgi:hypothetical protein